MTQYAIVDGEGIIIETVITNQKEVPSNYILPNYEKRLFRPKWNFENKTWEEGLSEIEVNKIESEIKQQQNRLSDVEMNAIALMELTEMIMKGGQ